MIQQTRYLDTRIPRQVRITLHHRITTINRTMAPLPCLQEVELIHLSRDIPHNKYSELCLALGFSYNQNQSILQKNRNDNIRAMEEILNMWNTEQADKNDSRSILVKKLHDVKLYECEQKLSKGEYPPKQQDPHEQEATPLQSSSGEYLLKQQDPHEQKATPLQSIPDSIYLEKISESLTVQQCREKLESRYLNKLCKIQMKPWDHTDYAEFEDMHTVVTMLKKDAHGKDTNKKEILQGSVAEIFSTKVKGVLPARILVSAPAGRGKTTAVAKMAYDWVHRERGSALEHLPLLFVVKFRITSQLASIGEAIKSQLLSDVDDLTPEGLEKFIKENQGICHVILDGLDEYAGISSTQRSSGISIVSVIRWEEFPECRVLVTTRPHLDKFFDQDDLPRVYAKMWIEGFSRARSREYIDKFFASTSNPNNIHGYGLKVYLDDQPLIDELVKTPLFCLMICHLWSEGLLHHDTTTQTELLNSVNIFLMHYANERLKSRVKITSEELTKIICQIGEVALTGLLDDAKKLVFTPHDFRKIPAALDRACEFGLVSKTTVNIKCLPKSNETTSTTIEFYHKLAQEHSAGKFLASKTKKYMLRLKISKLDILLHQIKANIGDYENLLRFAAGSDNSLCIRIMEAVLANSLLNESERYRIILDCSSETNGTEGKVSSLVQRCVNAECVVLKAPTVYTVVGMQNLPNQLKREVKTIRFEGSTLTTDVTSGLWSCLKSFSMLRTLTISDSSLSFCPSPPELPSVTKLSADRVTSQSYEGLLSSLPGLEEVDIKIGDANTEYISRIQTILRRHLTGQDLTRINPHSFTSEENASSKLRKRMIGLGFFTTECQAILSGVVFGPNETVIDLVQTSTRLMSASLYVEQVSSSLNFFQEPCRIEMWTIKDCQLSNEMTVKLWSSLRSYTPHNQLTISDSSLRFPLSPFKLPSVKKLLVVRVTSQSYEGLLSSLPGLEEVDITIGDANTEDISRIQTSLRRHLMGQYLTRIDPHSFTSEGNVLSMSRKRMRELGLLIIEGQAILSGIVFGPKETMIDFVHSSTRLMSASLYAEQFSKSLNFDQDAVHINMWTIKDCQLSTEMTEKLWTSLRSFTKLNQLTISDSSLSFSPSPPELPSVTKLSAEKVTAQSYAGVLSSIPGVRDLDVSIDVAETSSTFQITTAASIPTSQTRAGDEQFVVHIRLHDSTYMTIASGEEIGRLSLIFEDQTMNQHQLHVSGVKGRDEEALVDLFVKTKQLTDLNTGVLCRRGGGYLNEGNVFENTTLEIEQCQLSTKMTEKLWSSLRSLNALNQLTISDSSLTFLSSPPELPYVTKLLIERVTPQRYEGLLSSLPGLRDIDITIDDADRDIPQITACLRRTGGQQLTAINLTAPPSLPSEKKSVSRETMRGLGLLITEQTLNLNRLDLSGVKCLDEDDLVDFIECCRHVKGMSYVGLEYCGTTEGGRLESHLEGFHTSIRRQFTVWLRHDDKSYLISHIG